MTHLCKLIFLLQQVCQWSDTARKVLCLLNCEQFGRIAYRRLMTQKVST